MIDLKTLDKYKVTIGIECHVQLKTKTKLFAGVDNDAREAPPNTLVSHICFGLPGALPVLNKEAIHLAIRAAFALNTKPQSFSKFDRKHYFYPDLPMGYQITQYDNPIIKGGYVNINSDTKTKKINITRAHLEADAGKSTHDKFKDYSLVDLNRAGTPLLEIVSEPEMTSALEAKNFAKELYLTMRYANVSEANLFYGNMRFDVNVSVSKTKVLGTRSETKNLNSFKSIEKAVNYEVKRQIEIIEKNGIVVQQTRGWDEVKQKTFLQRTKEDADDYRYMPDPDLPPVILNPDYVSKIGSEMPVMPGEWRDRLSSLGLDQSQIDTLLDAEVDVEDISYLPLIELHLTDKNEAKFLANWFVNLEIPLRRDDKLKTVIKDSHREELYLGVHKLYKENLISSTNVKLLLLSLLKNDVLPEDIQLFADNKGLLQLSNESQLDHIVKEVIKENPKAANDIINGELKAIGFLVGQVMNRSQGQANPSIAAELIKKNLKDK